MKTKKRRVDITALWNPGPIQESIKIDASQIVLTPENMICEMEEVEEEYFVTLSDGSEVSLGSAVSLVPKGW